jgi:O-antigen/teichoic acid export membrane protein
MIAQKITYNILINGIAKILSIALALFGIGMLTRYLGPEGFGKYTTMLAFFAFFSAIGDFGLYTISTREISRENADERSILSKVFTLRLIISVVIFTLSTVFVWFLPYEKEVQVSILIASAAFIFSSSYGLLNGIFQKYIAMDKVAFTELSGKVIQIAIIIFVVKMNYGFIIVAFSLFITMLWNFVILYFLSRSYVTITLTNDWKYWQMFIKESLPMGISAIVTFLYFKFNAIILSFLQTQYDVGIYGVAYKIIETLVFFPAMVVGLVFPLFSRHIFTNTILFNKIANIVLKFFMIILTPLVVCTIFLAPQIIGIVGGAEFIDSVIVLQILIFALACIFFGQMFSNILIAATLQKKLMVILIIAAIMNILLNIIFISQYSYTGAAMVSVITEAFVMIATILIAVRYTSFTLISKNIIPIIIAGAIMVGIFTLMPTQGFGVAALNLFVYFALLFIFRVITRDDIIHILPKRT